MLFTFVTVQEDRDFEHLFLPSNGGLWRCWNGKFLGPQWNGPFHKLLPSLGFRSLPEGEWLPSLYPREYGSRAAGCDIQLKSVKWISMKVAWIATRTFWIAALH